MENEIFKTLGIMPDLAKLILAGEKTVTWRMFDDKNLQTHDKLIFVNRKTGEEYAKAEITSIIEKKLGDISAEDYDGHEKFKNKEEMYKTYRGYYGPKVNENYIVKIIKFKLI